MRTARITRSPSTDAGTFGEMSLDDGTQFVTGELPDNNNNPGTSCIPAGTYTAKWFDSPKHGWCYQVYGVPERSMIEIHPANWMGDKALGLFCQLLGCIALGKSLGMLQPEGYAPQMAVLRSVEAITEFQDNLKQEDLELTIS